MIAWDRQWKVRDSSDKNMFQNGSHVPLNRQKYLNDFAGLTVYGCTAALTKIITKFRIDKSGNTVYD